MKTPLLLSFILIQGVLGQGIPQPGDVVPPGLGFTQAAITEPLQNFSEFDFQSADGEVVAIVYHTSW